jgi:glycosyltransferase involved in cell wall biosynthesis
LIGGSGHFSLPGVEIDNIPWSEDTEAEELARCHVGVMPLLDGRWERGKCGYKIIQYMAAGRPAVASAIGANKSIIVHEETGFLVQDPEEWISRLTELVANPVRLRAMGIAARHRAEAKYSLQHNALKLVESLQNAIGMHCKGKSSPASVREETGDDQFVPKLRQKIRARAG